MSLGLVAHIQGYLDDSITLYHEGLLTEPENTIYVEMLDRALASFASQDPVYRILKTAGQKDDTETKLRKRFGSYFEEKEATKSVHGEASPKKQQKAIVTFTNSPVTDAKGRVEF